jgi:hypothetical protein
LRGAGRRRTPRGAARFRSRRTPDGRLPELLAPVANKPFSALVRPPLTPLPPIPRVAYFSSKTLTGQVFLAEITFKAGTPMCKLCVKSEAAPFAAMAKDAIERCLK